MTDPRHDHFALFGLPPRFAIDEASLEQAYRRVQSQVHPDRFAAEGERFLERKPRLVHRKPVGKIVVAVDGSAALAPGSGLSPDQSGFGLAV